MSLFHRLAGLALATLMVLVAAGVAMYFWQSYQQRAFARRGAERAPVRVVDHGALPSEVGESSGLAVSRAHPGVFWTHNDSGDGPRLYALDSTAALLATFEVGRAEARDWEALDIGPCPAAEPSEWCLYVGDTGDNARDRDHVTIYVVPEPDPVGRVDRVEALGGARFTYGSGRFDAEAVAVTPEGDVVVATKGRAPSLSVFLLPANDVARALGTGEILTLASGVTLPIEPDFSLGRWITGGALDAEGTLLALRTYTEVYFYEWPMADPPAQAAPTCFLGLIEPNGEAVAFSGDGRLFLTSESPGPLVGHLLEIECTGADGVRAPGFRTPS